MTSLHMIGHMVTVAVIAGLVKQLMQLKFNLHDLKIELCDEHTDTAEFRNNFCERGSRHWTESSEMETEAKSETKPNTDLKTRIKTTTELIKELSSEEVVKKTETNTETQVDMKSDKEQEHFVESSVWCQGQKNELCHFHNLCYNTDDDDLFIMIGNDTVFENVNFSDGSILIELSSVQNHNVHQKYVGSIPSDISGKLNISWIKETVLLFNRFKPDNLMHVLHDDILPVYHSLRLISMSHEACHYHEYEKPRTQLIFFEGWETGDFGELYQLFSSYPIVLKESLKSKSSVVCFSNAYTGVSTSTTWYDYGFHKPQGPIDNSKVTSTMIHSLAKYMLQHLQIGSNIQPSTTEYLVLLTRKQNRKIINEVELTLGIVQTFGMKVISVNFEMFDLSDILHIVHSSRGIIGMHGSLLSLAMFLRPGSILLELFPYAVIPDHYTPFKTLASIEGMGITYKAWRNVDPEKTLGYPERSPDEGGLRHLSVKQRTEIMEQTEVPQHQCCSDPSWLYHIYQDTEVHVIEVVSLVRHSLEAARKYSGQAALRFYSTQVKNISCVRDDRAGKLRVSWKIPWIFEHTDNDSKGFHYEILVQNMVDKSAVKSYVAVVPPFVIDIDKKGSYYIWVRSFQHKTINGPYSNTCKCIVGSD